MEPRDIEAGTVEQLAGPGLPGERVARRSRAPQRDHHIKVCGNTFRNRVRMLHNRVTTFNNRVKRVQYRVTMSHYFRPNCGIWLENARSRTKAGQNGAGALRVRVGHVVPKPERGCWMLDPGCGRANCRTEFALCGPTNPKNRLVGVEKQGVFRFSDRDPRISRIAQIAPTIRAAPVRLGRHFIGYDRQLEFATASWGPGPC